MVELSRAIAESPSDLVGRFEDAPYFYWRLCSKSGRSIRTMSLEQVGAHDEHWPPRACLDASPPVRPRSASSLVFGDLGLSVQAWASVYTCVQTYREIYKQTMAKTRFEQVIDAGAHHHILSIGLCQVTTHTTKSS